MSTLPTTTGNFELWTGLPFRRHLGVSLSSLKCRSDHSSSTHLSPSTDLLPGDVDLKFRVVPESVSPILPPVRSTVHTVYGPCLICLRPSPTPASTSVDVGQGCPNSLRA